MTAPPYKVGMIGVGDITPLHFEAYRGFDLATVAMICDLDTSLLERRKEEYGVPESTTDYRALLSNPEIDIVEVNTPHHTHHRLVVEALDAGKHVACQKPMSTSVTEAREMLDAERRGAGSLRILENFVYYPPYVKALELLEAGEIGEVLTIRFKLGTGLFGSRWIPLVTNLWHLREVEKGMGWAVFDDGWHKLSMAVHLIGEIERVQGFIDRSMHLVDEPAQLSWRYRGRPSLGSFDIAFSPNLYTPSKYFPADERVDIVGTRGMITLTQCTAQIVDQAPLILYRDGRRHLFEDLETDWQASFTAGIRDFPRALMAGRKPLLTGERALHVTQFAYALIIAARTGTEICPDAVDDEMISRELLGGK